MNFMNQVKLFLIMLSLLAVHTPSDAGQARSKPQPPVRVSISPVQTGLASANIKPGDVVEFRVTIHSSVDASEMRINNSLEDGLELVAGELMWTGQVRRDEEVSVAFNVRSTLKGKGKIISRVEVSSGDVLLYATTSVYDMSAPGKAKPRQPRAVGKDRRGQGVVEYR